MANHGAKRDVFSHIFKDGTWQPDPGAGSVTVDEAKNYVWDSAASSWVPQPYSVNVSTDTTAIWGDVHIGSCTTLAMTGTVYIDTCPTVVIKGDVYIATAVTLNVAGLSSGGGDTNVKTVYGDILSLTTVSGGQQYTGAAFDCTNYQHGVVFFDFAPVQTSTPAVGTELKIEGAHKVGTSDGWRTMVVFRTGTAQAVASTTPGDCPAGTNYFAKNPAPSYTVTDRIFFLNNVDITKSEWAEVTNVIGADGVYFRDPLTNTQASSTVYNKGEQFIAFLRLEDFTKIRAVVNNGLHANSYNVAVRVRVNVGTL